MTKKHHHDEHGDHEHHKDATAHTADDWQAQLKTCQEACESLEQKAQANWEKFIRVTADMENVRKRASKDVENAHKFALEKFMKELVPVLDSLEQGLVAVPASETADEAFNAVYQGIDLTHKQLVSVLEKFGLVTLFPEGEHFDPHVHEAMLMQPGSGHPSGTVLTVVQRGYQLNGRLIRAARVIVAQ